MQQLWIRTITKPWRALYIKQWQDQLQQSMDSFSFCFSAQFGICFIPYQRSVFWRGSLYVHCYLKIYTAAHNFVLTCNWVTLLSVCFPQLSYFKLQKLLAFSVVPEKPVHVNMQLKSSLKNTSSWFIKLISSYGIY